MLHLFRIGLILLSWTSVIFLPKKLFFKYLAVTLFSSIIILIEYLLGGPRNWWKAKGGIKAVANTGLIFIFGPYFVGNLWIFHLTFGPFCLSSIFILLADFLLAYPLNTFFELLNLYKLPRIGPLHLFFLSLVYSFAKLWFPISFR